MKQKKKLSPISHLLGQSSMLGKLRAEFFDKYYYITSTEIVDKNKQIMSFVHRTNQLQLSKDNNYYFSSCWTQEIISDHYTALGHVSM